MRIRVLGAAAAALALVVGAGVWCVVARAVEKRAWSVPVVPDDGMRTAPSDSATPILRTVAPTASDRDGDARADVPRPGRAAVPPLRSDDCDPDALPSASVESTADTTHAARVERLPRERVPGDATLLRPDDGTRTWAVLDRAPCGLVHEPGAVPGRVVVHLSRPAREPVEFAISAEPPGALRLPRETTLRIAPGRDAASFAFASVECGRAQLVLRPAGGADADAATLRVDLECASIDDLADPLLVVTVALSDDFPGAIPAGDRALRALPGTAAGAVRVRRTGFREFATRPTDVLVAADDPDGVLDSLPHIVTIPVGAAELPEPLVIRLRESAGRALLRFRSGTQEATVTVDAVAPRWEALPEPIVVPRGARVRATLRLVPATRRAPAFDVAVDPPAAVRAALVPKSAAPCPEEFVLDVEGVSEGATVLRVRAAARPEATIPASVVAAEIDLRDRQPVVLAARRAAGGELVLELAPTARWAPTSAAGSTEVVGVGTRRVEVRLAPGAAADADMALPVRIEGRTAALRVSSRTQDGIRSVYEVDVDAPPR